MLPIDSVLEPKSEGTQSLSVLFVEDNVDDVVLLEEILHLNEDISYSVMHASFLEDALDLCRLRDFDVVLLDLNLADSDVQRSIQAIRKLSTSVPVIVLSGHVDENIRQRALSNGALACLSKDVILGPNLQDEIYTAYTAYRPAPPS